MLRPLQRDIPRRPMAVDSHGGRLLCALQRSFWQWRKTSAEIIARCQNPSITHDTCGDGMVAHTIRGAYGDQIKRSRGLHSFLASIGHYAEHAPLDSRTHSVWLKQERPCMQTAPAALLCYETSDPSRVVSAIVSPHEPCSSKHEDCPCAQYLLRMLETP